MGRGDSPEKIPAKWKNEKIFNQWNKLNNIRQVCNSAIEIQRSDKKLGSSLEADLEIYLNEDYSKLVKDIDLSEYCITSVAKSKTQDSKIQNLFELENIPGIKVLVKKAEGNKCPRCWKIVKNKCIRCEDAKVA